MTLIEAIDELRSLQEKYEHDNRGAGPDFYEVERFFKWAEERELLRIAIRENPPASTPNTASAPPEL